MEKDYKVISYIEGVVVITPVQAPTREEAIKRVAYYLEKFMVQKKLSVQELPQDSEDPENEILLWCAINKLE